MRRRITTRSWTACILAGLLVVGGSASCVTVKVAEIPPPEHECPTDADLDMLADWLPETTEAEMTALRYRKAQAYCLMAWKRLR